MATLIAKVSTPVEDSEALQKAFKGIIYTIYTHLYFIWYIFLKLVCLKFVQYNA